MHPTMLRIVTLIQRPPVEHSELTHACAAPPLDEPEPRPDARLHALLSALTSTLPGTATNTEHVNPARSEDAQIHDLLRLLGESTAPRSTTSAAPPAPRGLLDAAQAYATHPAMRAWIAESGSAAAQASWVHRATGAQLCLDIAETRPTTLRNAPLGVLAAWWTHREALEQHGRLDLLEALRDRTEECLLAVTSTQALVGQRLGAPAEHNLASLLGAVLAHGTEELLPLLRETLSLPMVATNSSTLRALGEAAQSSPDRRLLLAPALRILTRRPAWSVSAQRHPEDGAGHSVQHREDVRAHVLADLRALIQAPGLRAAFGFRPTNPLLGRWAQMLLGSLATALMKQLRDIEADCVGGEELRESVLAAMYWMHYTSGHCPFASAAPTSPPGEGEGPLNWPALSPDAHGAEISPEHIEHLLGCCGAHLERSSVPVQAYLGPAVDALESWADGNQPSTTPMLWHWRRLTAPERTRLAPKLLDQQHRALPPAVVHAVVDHLSSHAPDLLAELIGTQLNQGRPTSWTVHHPRSAVLAWRSIDYNPDILGGHRLHPTNNEVSAGLIDLLIDDLHHITGQPAHREHTDVTTLVEARPDDTGRAWLAHTLPTHAPRWSTIVATAHGPAAAQVLAHRVPLEALLGPTTLRAETRDHIESAIANLLSPLFDSPGQVVNLNLLERLILLPDLTVEEIVAAYQAVNS